ncbi:MAG: pilus assembly protein [Acidobacteriota bacterium]
MRAEKNPFLTLLGVALLAAFAAGTTARADEGYDPMLQITHQFARPNIYIVMDVSGSMAWDLYGSDVGVDERGTLPTASWSLTSSSDCSRGKCKSFTYRLTVTQTFPSRMTTVKNALGNSVTIVTPWIEPPEWEADESYAYITDPDWQTGTITGPTISHSGSSHTYTWKVSYSARKSDPGVPFVAYDSAGKPTVGTGGVSQAPLDLIGDSADVVNWGLITYSGSNCSTHTRQVAIDSNDTGVVTGIEERMRLNSAGGLGAGGSTPTRGALTFAKTELQATYDADPKYNCGRTYAAILVTDGLSNNCNPSGKNWIDPCGSPPYACDAGSSGYDCDERNGKDRNYDAFPPGISEEIWNLDLSENGSEPIKVRTWVIGVSNAVSRCELNFTAYMGHTDADSPNGDAGFDFENDPYLPASTGDESNYVIDSTHTNYAYFASTSGALKNAFASIVAAVATGDYTTSAPVASSTISDGNVAMLASAEFPTWKGHLYCYDINNLSTIKWDAGEVLAATSASGRSIYTWNSSNQLVEVKATNLASLRTIAAEFTPAFDTSQLTAEVVDFVRGNNGSGTARPWKLGPIINSAPAIVQAPDAYKQGKVADHTTFEAGQKDRTALVWIGSNDGMLHAFKVADGSEVVALLPPNLLAKQVLLYNTFQADPTANPVGQPKMPSDHVYTVARSPRYGDVYFSNLDEWRTVMLLTEGPGGDLLAALDVTSPVSTDDNHIPLKVLWTRTGQYPSSLAMTGLKETWSIPAFGYTGLGTAKGIVGSGRDPSSTAASQVTPSAFIFDPATGTFSTKVLGVTTPALVGNQAFAPGVMYAMTAEAYYPDSLVDLALQADLNGRIWFLPYSTFTPVVGIDASAVAGQSQPLYYSPAASGYYKGSTGYDLYAFGSGTFYEKSAAVTGPNVGTTGYFEPSLYVVAKEQTAAAATSDQILRIPIKSLLKPGSDTETLGRRTQLTATAMLFVPVNSDVKPLALFSVYDPDTADCAGTSYIVRITFDITEGAPSLDSSTTYEAGSGASSGFAIAGNRVIVARSGVGKGKKATISTVPGVNPSQGTSNPEPNWWRELK